jgi:hypothetical protein
MLPLLLAVMILQPAAPPPAEPSPALVDRFIAAIPEAQRLGLDGRSNDEAEARMLITINPARAAEIRRIADTHAACAAPLLARTTENGLRWLALRLGDGPLTRIIQFHESGDALFLGELEERSRGGEAPNATDQARVERIFAEYPLRDYFEAIEASYGREDPLAAELIGCDIARDDALTQLGLRYPD